MAQVRWAPPERTGKPPPAALLLARPFAGIDTEIDFTAAEPEAVVTDLLAACLSDGEGTRFSKNEIWHWTLKRRTQGLLAVAVASCGAAWEATRRCANPGCREIMEIPIDLSQFRQDWRSERVAVAVDETRTVEVRLPRAEDLKAWRAEGVADPEAMVRRLVAVPEAPDPTWTPRIEAALSAADPLTDLVLETTCPYCGADNAVPFPLEDSLLAALRRLGERLLEEIHLLASTYHWSEAEILALPAGRRRFYLARIAEESAA
jgi:hypothetical protein